jgi:plasmid stability protein
MSTVHLPDELVDRLQAEAARRGISVDDLAAETLTDRFPPAGADRGCEALEAFIGSGASGRREPFDIHQARADLAERKAAEGA